MSAIKIASRIDHTLLKPTTTKSQIIELCQEAKRWGFRAVCVNSANVPICTKLRIKNLKICSVIGFPLGAMSTEAKLAEAESAIRQGASELDLVINLGWLKDIDPMHIDTQGEQLLTNELALFSKQARHYHIITKLIIETGLLTREQKIFACHLATIAGFNFVKTCTGFSGGQATIEDIQLMRQHIGPRVKIKASGGIKDLATARAMIEAGADVIGTSSGVSIVMEEINTH